MRSARYGSDPSQVGDLHLPDAARPPVVCLLHGGFWRMPYGRDQMTSLADDLARRGYAAWNLEYRRVGAGGGWPATLDDVSRGIDQLATLAGDGLELDLERLATVGHSAGGHLALWAGGRHRLGGAPPRVRVAAAAGQAPIADLVHALGDKRAPLRNAVTTFLGGPDTAGDRAQATSPRALLPLGIPQLIVHGTADDVVPVEIGRRYTEAARAAGDPVELLELPGAGHFEHLDAGGPAWAGVVAWLDRIFAAPAR
jgi:acetyl esterase/lipase